MNVPKEISDIENLSEFPIDKFGAICGIYFLCQNDELKYIGQSTHIAQRIVQHINNYRFHPERKIETAFFIHCDLKNLISLERELIIKYQPPWNETCKKPPIAPLSETFKDPRVLKQPEVKATKFCPECKQIKPISEFFKTHSGRYSYAWCKKCKAKYYRMTRKAYRG